MLLDMGIAFSGGTTVLRHIRAEYPQIPIIMVSVSLDPDLMRDTVKLGAFHYIAKPFDYIHLADAIDAAVASRSA